VRLESVEQWSTRLRKWQKSGQSIEDFANSNGLKPRTLSFWRWKLGGATAWPGPSSRRARSSDGGPVRQQENPEHVEVSARSGRSKGSRVSVKKPPRSGSSAKPRGSTRTSRGSGSASRAKRKATSTTKQGTWVDASAFIELAPEVGGSVPDGDGVYELELPTGLRLRVPIKAFDEASLGMVLRALEVG
jgi:hypothetical protein